MVGIYHLLIDGKHIVQNGSVVKQNDKKMIKESKETQTDKFRSQGEKSLAVFIYINSISSSSVLSSVSIPASLQCWQIVSPSMASSS